VKASAEAGANRHLAKPVQPGVLLAALRAAMAGELEAA
jgi:DNA-binding response OmpR family regulator